MPLETKNTLQIRKWESPCVRFSSGNSFEVLLHSCCVGDVYAERVFVYEWQASMVTNDVQKLVLLDKRGNLKSQQNLFVKFFATYFWSKDY